MEKFDLDEFIKTEKYKEIESNLVKKSYNDLALSEKYKDKLEKVMKNLEDKKKLDEDKEFLEEFREQNPFTASYLLLFYSQPEEEENLLREEVTLNFTDNTSLQFMQDFAKEYNDGKKPTFLSRRNEQIKYLKYKFLSNYGKYSEYKSKIFIFLIFLALSLIFLLNPVVSGYLLAGLITLIVSIIIISIYIGFIKGFYESMGLIKTIIFGAVTVVGSIIVFLNNLTGSEFKEKFGNLSYEFAKMCESYGKYVSIVFAIVTLIFLVKAIKEIFNKLNPVLNKEKTKNKADKIIEEIKAEEVKAEDYMLERIVSGYTKYATIYDLRNLDKELMNIRAEVDGGKRVETEPGKYDVSVGRSFLMDNFLITNEKLKEMKADEYNVDEYLDFYIQEYNNFLELSERLSNYYNSNNEFDYNKALNEWGKQI